MTSIPAVQPVGQKKRIISLDLLRGFAILGILIMNIQGFSLPEAAYLNPNAYGDLNGANLWTWVISHVFADLKFMAIFSILFGAGVVLFSEKAMEKRGKSAGLHYRRNFWLLVIGLVHAHLIWHGDILVPYALCSFLVYLFRKARPRALLVIGLGFIMVPMIFNLFSGLTISYWPEESIAFVSQIWQPRAEAIQAEIAAFTGTWMEQFTKRSSIAIGFETFLFLNYFFWRVTGLMLMGMAFYKWGILSAQCSKAFYLRGFLISWGIGLPVVIYGVVQNFQYQWSLEYSFFLGTQFNYMASLLVAFGFICLVMLFSKSNGAAWIKDRLAAVGQMALTNYLMQSIICTFIFYGWGLGYFAQVERFWLLMIVFVVWTLQVLWSRPWLNRFRFGPFEWAWRSLTYWKLQPFRRG